MAPLGQNLVRVRLARGLTQDELAAASGVSVDSISRLERGARPTTRRSTLALLATALKIEQGVLLGTQGASVQHSDDVLAGGADLERSRGVPLERIRSPHLAAESIVALIRQAMRSDSLEGAEPISVAELAAEVQSAWAIWHSSPTPRTTVGVLLPELVRQSNQAVLVHDGAEKRQAQNTAGDLFRLVQRLLAHVAEHELHASAVDRGRSLSEAADTPGSLAQAAWSSAIAASALGDFDEALQVADAGFVLFERSASPARPALQGLRGALNLEAAAAHGFLRRKDAAADRMKAAAAISAHLPHGYRHPQSGFERSSVEVLSVIVDVAQGDFQIAIRRIRGVDPQSITSPVRRSRFFLEAALAHAHVREPFAMAHYLDAAVAECGEMVLPIPWTTDLIKTLLEMSPPSLRSTSLSLAARFAVPTDI